jgi:hypothetical protein
MEQSGRAKEQYRDGDVMRYWFGISVVSCRMEKVLSCPAYKGLLTLVPIQTENIN